MTLLKIMMGFLSTFLAASLIYGLFLVGGWFFPVLFALIAGVDYLLIKKIFLKN